MNGFINSIKEEAEMNRVATFTENGALARRSTGDNLVDLFGTIGAMRKRDEKDIVRKLELAWGDDPLLTLRTIFYSRDIRDGLGERKVARTCFQWLANNHPEVMKKNLWAIMEFGRADDFYCLIGTKVENEMWSFVRDIFAEDFMNMQKGKSISLLAKWLKSVNASSKETKALGKLTAKKLGLSQQLYRRALSKMREYLNVVEVNMSNKEFEKIAYSQVPAKAMFKYRKAFKKQDEERFTDYLDRVKKGKAEIKAGTLYPYDLVRNYLIYDTKEDVVIESQWKALPNYVNGENNVLVMADISGSMFTYPDYQPISTSIGLAIYFAERNKGAFENLYLTFNRYPSFIAIKKEESLCQKVYDCKRHGMGYSTNLEKAFEKILQVAVKNKVSQLDMPKALVVVSDMEIDGFEHYNETDFMTAKEKRFAAYGYKIPKVILWNVEARHDNFHARSDNPSVCFVSGSSPSIFKSVLESINLNAYETVVKTLTQKIYENILL